MEMAVMDIHPIKQFKCEPNDSLNVMQELQQQRESLKQNLHEMDKSIKKLTGRDPIENRRNSIENRRLSSIKRVPLKRESIDDGDNHPPKRLSTEKRRWGSTAFGKNNEMDSGGEEKEKEKEKETKRPTVQSSVVVTGKPIAPQLVKKEDVTMKKRDKRMFRLLLGTLKQFKQDAQMKTETESKQEEKMIQVEEKVQREKDDAAERKKDLMETRHGKKLELEELEFKIAMAELNQELQSHYDQFNDFIQLKSTPCIFYKPAEHNEKTEKLLKDSQTCLKDSLQQRLKEISMCTEEDIQTARIPWDSDENRTSKVKSRRDHPESHRLFRYGDERVSNTGNRGTREQGQHRKKSVSGKSITDPIVLDHLSSKKDPITVVDDDREKVIREKVTVIVEDTINSTEEDDNEPVKDLPKVVVDLESTDSDNIVLPEGEISAKVKGNDEFAYVDWGKFDDDDDDNGNDDNDDDNDGNDNDTGKNVRPNFLDLGNKTQKCDDSDKNEDTPIQIEGSEEKDHESDTDIGIQTNETDIVNENDQPSDKEESFDVDKGVDRFEDIGEHNQVIDQIESHTQASKDNEQIDIEDIDMLAQSSCQSDDHCDVRDHTGEDFYDRGQSEKDIQDNELTENDITDNEQIEKYTTDNKHAEKDNGDSDLTEKDIEDSDLTENDIEGSDLTEKYITDNEQTEKNIQGSEHVQEVRDMDRDIREPDHTDNEEIETRNLFTAILPIVNNDSANADDLFPQNEYADQLLEQVVDKERALMSPPSIVSPYYNVIDERVFKKSIENQTLQHTKDIDTRTESDNTPNADSDFNTIEDEVQYSIGLFAKEYPSWQQG